MTPERREQLIRHVVAIRCPRELHEFRLALARRRDGHDPSRTEAQDAEVFAAISARMEHLARVRVR